MPRFIPAGSQFWPDHESWRNLNPKQIAAAYSGGFAGAWKDQEAKEQLRDQVRQAGFSFKFADIAHSYGFADTQAGKLVVPFRLVEYVFPGCWPGAAQERGDCVSHGSKNATLVTFACDIAFGKPDESTGALEVAPEIPPEGIADGAFSPESIYWWRGYNGDGWDCDTGSSMVMKHGILLRKPYSGLGFDLTTYSGSKAGMYGSRSPGSEIDAEQRLHPCRTIAEANSFEEVRDALGRGYGLNSCGGEGFSSSRDENGYSPRSGGWSHSMAVIGADDRPLIKSKYGEPLVLIINSWAKWNGGGRRILGTNIDIPEGSFWTKWSSVKNRDYHVHSGAQGWQRSKLDPFRLSIAL